MYSIFTTSSFVVQDMCVTTRREHWPDGERLQYYICIYVRSFSSQYSRLFKGERSLSDDSKFKTLQQRQNITKLRIWTLTCWILSFWYRRLTGIISALILGYLYRSTRFILLVGELCLHVIDFNHLFKTMDSIFCRQCKYFMFKST